MSVPPSDPKPPRYALGFLTDQWEWRADLDADTPEAAKAAAREALIAVVRDETPELACVTLIDNGVKVGVWDWIETRPYWTPL
ncbi:hypothetical protein [Phenylobacterium zucineum]|uniref:hypothetical protein n=1 Tax=Phenylobacterium zucineum TaxID=284016 RepID=UPI0002DAD99E|nr:hypothetical protein [Phenylobacterium zucineum]